MNCRATSIILTIFLLFCCESAYSQTDVYASLPCHLVPQDTALQAYSIDHHRSRTEDSHPKLINRKEVENCAGRAFLSIMTAKAFIEYGSRFFMKRKNITLFGIMVNEEGSIHKICQASPFEVSKDQFQLVSCLEDLKFKPPKSREETKPSLFFVVIKNE